MEPRLLEVKRDTRRTNIFISKAYSAKLQTHTLIATFYLKEKKFFFKNFKMHIFFTKMFVIEIFALVTEL